MCSRGQRFHWLLYMAREVVSKMRVGGLGEQHLHLGLGCTNQLDAPCIPIDAQMPQDSPAVRPTFHTPGIRKSALCSPSPVQEESSLLAI